MSDLEPNRFVVIDDTDSRIKYEGSGWHLTSAGTTDGWGIFGPAYNHTLHETFEDGSLSFRFNGTKIILSGTIDTINNQPRPSWICIIDGKGTGRIDAKMDQHTNHWVFCDIDIDGLQEHLVVLNVTVPDGAVFRLDDVLYAPSLDVVEGETLLIQDTASMLTYHPELSWNHVAGITHDTDAPGSSLAFTFTGTTATLYSCLQPNLIGSVADYSIDGGPPIPFSIPSHNDINRLFNQPLFTATGLSPTEHILTVNYTGQRGNTPLSLDYFIITLPPAPGGSGKSTPAVKGPSDSECYTPVGAIAGGIIGGIVGLCILGLFILAIIRRRHYRHPSSPKPELIPFLDEHELEDNLTNHWQPPTS